METEKTSPPLRLFKKKKSLHIIRNACRTYWLLVPFPQHLLKPENVPVKPRSLAVKLRRLHGSSPALLSSRPAWAPTRGRAEAGEAAGAGLTPPSCSTSRDLGGTAGAGGVCLCSSSTQNYTRAKWCELEC